MSLRDEWLADPEPISFAEWMRRRTVPGGLRTLPPMTAPQAEVRRSYESGVNPNGNPLVHGSTQGRRRHIQAGEEVCPECIAGHEREKARRAAERRAQRALKHRQ